MITQSVKKADKNPPEFSLRSSEQSAILRILDVVTRALPAFFVERAGQTRSAGGQYVYGTGRFQANNAILSSLAKLFYTAAINRKAEVVDSQWLGSRLVWCNFKFVKNPDYGKYHKITVTN